MTENATVQTMTFLDASVTTICPREIGLLVGLTNGEVRTLEKFSDPNDPSLFVYQEKSRSILPGDGNHAVSISMGPGEIATYVLTNRRQLLEITLDENTAEHITGLNDPFHIGPVLSLDTCARKPLLVTCGVDNAIRLWNYETNRIEICKYYPEEPYSVSLHPSGCYLAVGFNDKLRMLNIFVDDMSFYAEFNIRSCKEVFYIHFL